MPLRIPASLREVGQYFQVQLLIAGGPRACFLQQNRAPTFAPCAPPRLQPRHTQPTFLLIKPDTGDAQSAATHLARGPGTSHVSPELPLREETATPGPKICGHLPPSTRGVQGPTPCSVSLLPRFASSWFSAPSYPA